VRLLPEGEIKFKLLDNHWVEIISDRKKYKMVGMARENFPALPAMPHTLVKIPAAVLESLIGKTKFAISMEESRYTLNGGQTHSRWLLLTAIVSRLRRPTKNSLA